MTVFGLHWSSFQRRGAPRLLGCLLEWLAGEMGSVYLARPDRTAIERMGIWARMRREELFRELQAIEGEIGALLEASFAQQKQQSGNGASFRWRGATRRLRFLAESSADIAEKISALADTEDTCREGVAGGETHLEKVNEFLRQGWWAL